MKLSVLSKTFLHVFVIFLAVNLTPDINAGTINLLDNAITTDPTKMHDKSAFYKTWECYWKNGEIVPEKSRPISYYAEIVMHESQLAIWTPGHTYTIGMSGSPAAGFSEGNKVVVLDYPETSEAKDFYYRIPIEVPESGDYTLTGSVFCVKTNPSKSITVSKTDYNFCTKTFFALFTSEKSARKKSFEITATPSLIDTYTKKTVGYHSLLYKFLAPINAVIPLDKDDKYLCVYAPPCTENYNEKSVIILGNLKLEPNFTVTEPVKEAVSFRHFSRTLYVGESYSLSYLGLNSPAGINLNNADITVSCNDSDMFEITGSGMETKITPEKAHTYGSSGSTLPTSTLTVTYKANDGTTETAKLRLHVAPINQQTHTSFDYTTANQAITAGDGGTIKTPVSISGTPTNVIATQSAPGSWNAYLYNIVNESNTATANNAATGDSTLPGCSYVEGQGWTINFGDQVREYRLKLESNIEQSGYKKNPAYVLQELEIYVDKSGTQSLSVTSMFNDNSDILYKELEPDEIGGEHFYVGYDGASGKEISIKASGTLVIKKINLQFTSNFTIPTPGFMNVDNKKYTYITLTLPVDENNKLLWDENNTLQLQYLITPDETAGMQTMSEVADTNMQEIADNTEPEWQNYTIGDQLTFNEGEKLTARTLHPHGMISAPASIGYFVITGVEEIESEDSSDVRYFTLQGIESNRPESGPYIEVRNGKATKRIATGH